MAQLGEAITARANSITAAGRVVCQRLLQPREGALGNSSVPYLLGPSGRIRRFGRLVLELSMDLKHSRDKDHQPGAEGQADPGCG
jgi:hypothetical protein